MTKDCDKPGTVAHASSHSTETEPQVEDQAGLYGEFRASQPWIDSEPLSEKKQRE